MIKIRKFLRRNIRYLAIACLLVLLAVGFFAWRHYNNTHKKVATIPTKNSVSQKTTAPSNPDKQTALAGGYGSSGGMGGGSTKNTAASTSSSSIVDLIAPTGQFVSNHHPGENGSPTTEQSVCNTSPGASCYIQFTKDGLSRSLPAQTTDTNGSTYWTWDIGSAGLSSGAWKITAVATGGGQTKSAQDATDLVVQ